MNLRDAYLSGEDEGSRFLGPPPSVERLIERARSHQRSESHRKSMRILASYVPHEVIKNDQEVGRSLQLLKEDPVFICTGQQPALFGGPLLSFYKAVTAIVLARRLSEQGVPAIPLFWNASEDHDFDEANRFCIPSSDPALEPALHKVARPKVARSLSQIRMSEEDRKRLEELCRSANLSPSFFSHADEDIGAWNTRLLYQLTAGTGMLVCEPHWFADHLVSFRRDFLLHRSQLVELLHQQDDALSGAGFSLPVQVRTGEGFHFIDIEERGRTKVRFADDDTALIGEETWPASRVLEHLEKNPDRFSSSVLSRPIAQQYLFPVVAQVAGPTELAYLAQLRQCYAPLGQEAPVIWPRAHFLLLDSTLRGFVDELRLTDDDLVRGRFPDVSPKEDPALASLVDELHQVFVQADQIHDTDIRKKAIDLRRQLMKEIKALKKESSRRQKKRTKPQMRMVHLLNQARTPRGIPQERIMSVMSLGFSADTALLRLIEAAIDIESPEMKVVWTKEKATDHDHNEN